MAQNDNTGAYIGFAVIATGLLIMVIFAMFIVEIGALAFGAFMLMVVNWRYKIIGVSAGFLFGGFLTPFLRSFINTLYQEFDIGALIWAYQLAPWSLIAIGFILTVWILDFINDQRNMPTSDDDFKAWRIKWGFTKGLDLEKQDKLPQSSSASDDDVFDVPPQNDR